MIPPPAGCFGFRSHFPAPQTVPSRCPAAQREPSSRQRGRRRVAPRRLYTWRGRSPVPSANSGLRTESGRRRNHRGIGGAMRRTSELEDDAMHGISLTVTLDEA